MTVEFMERNGGLSRPSGGPRGRKFIRIKWTKMSEKLNSEGSGESSSEEKWLKIEELPDNVDVYIIQEETTDEFWNTAGTSSQHTVAAPQSSSESAADQLTATTDEEQLKPPPSKKKKYANDIVKLFIECDKNAREYARERDLANEKLEMERLRLREYEVSERLRQKDQELCLQAHWFDFIKEGMDLIKKYFELDTEEE